MSKRFLTELLLAFVAIGVLNVTAAPGWVGYVVGSFLTGVIFEFWSMRRVREEES